MPHVNAETKVLNLTSVERRYIKYYRLLDNKGRIAVDILLKQERDRSIKELGDEVFPKIKKSPPKD